MTAKRQPRPSAAPEAPQPRTCNAPETLATRAKSPGRPPMKLPPDGLAKIRELAARGLTEQGISYALGMRRDGIKTLKGRPGGELIEQAIFEGRQVEHESLHHALFKKATQGDGKEGVIAAIFLLKARHGYVEAREAMQTPTVNVAISMPGAMRPEDYEKLVRVVPAAPPPALEEPQNGTQRLSEARPPST